ncbi:hypothetical protein [Proteiniphilum sp.]|uniref:hypothetical protein n=1 Tax=Proteiniphilum sp. TaxID=1926877 RepID=UPI002B21C10A|nr:hypothetical protein [Proteiniphilum sp.]MEA4916829.1 hypothetical protein [Proteiniphilum sp.]
MKTKHIYSLLLVVLLAALITCEKADSDKDWGNSLIYLPQAALLDGGNTIHYPVPFDKNAALQNYIIDSTGTNTIKVIMGVYRSGLEELQGYSVSVLPNPAVLQQKLAEIEDSFELPADLYSFPATVDVPDGKRGADFYVTIDRKRLLEEYGHLRNKSMIIALSIDKPTRYTLNDKLSTVVVVINMSEFVPEPVLPNILAGGEFNPGDEAYWTVVKQDPMTHDTDISFAGGKLRFSTSPGSLQTNYAVYQAVEVVQGKKYQLRGDIETENVTNGWFEFFLHPNEPEYGGDYSFGRFLEFTSWTEGCLGTISGNIQDLYCGGSAAPGAIFTSNFSGTVFFVMKAGVWDGSIGKIEVDNLKILELED